MGEGLIYLRQELASRQQLVDLIEQLSNGLKISTYRYQERVEAVELGWADVAWRQLLSRVDAGIWPIGRLFCETFELRWQVADIKADSFDIQVFAETSQDLPDPLWVHDHYVVGECYQVYLWGKRKARDTGWIETRIPRHQDYPLDWHETKRFAAVYARDYRRSGVVRATRLTGVVAVSRPEL